MKYYIDDFRRSVSYNKALAFYKIMLNINDINIKDKWFINKNAGKIASNIALAYGSNLYIDKEIYNYKQAVKYTYRVENKLKEIGFSDKEYINKLVEIRKLLYYYIKSKEQ